MSDGAGAIGGRELAAVRAQAGLASTLALVAIVVISVTTVLGYFIEPLVTALRTTQRDPAAGPFWILGVVGPQLVLALPLFMFADTLGALRRALEEYASGRFFSVTAGRAVKRAGEIAALALVVKILITPTLHDWVTGAGNGIKFDFEIFDLGLIAFALFVSAVGRVLVAAAEIKAENDQIV